jgi:enoyl-CoA hydratase
MKDEKTGQGGLVTYHRSGHLGFITLNRAEKRNAMNLALWRALDEAVGEAEKDREARVVLLRGNGRSFCAGLDLGPENELVGAIGAAASAEQKTTFFSLIRKTQEIHNRLERLPRPTVAVIHGHCLGAGLELVLCCDIRLCSSETVFAMPEVKLATIMDVGGLQRLPRVVGPGAAREIIFRGHAFDAQKARAINLVNEVYPDPEILAAKATEMAEEIAANPPLAVQGTKEVMLFDQGANLHESLAYNAARSCMILPSEDLMEAIGAYLQKRKGDFKGR